MSWLTYKIISETSADFTHFSKMETPSEAQLEWEKKFNQKAISIALDDDDSELDFFDLFEEAE